jgi:choline kinase
MTERPLVCILTAGCGTRMGPYAQIINKALLPIDFHAVISRIIGLFPAESDFVIALGYRADQVRAYLSIAHPTLSVQYVTVSPFEGPGSGPGYSLLSCRKELSRPFYFVASDTLFEAIDLVPPNANWAGVARLPLEQSAAYCNLRVEGDRVVGITDKQRIETDDFVAFTGFLHVHDHEAFWDGLADVHITAGEHQVSDGLHALMKGPGLRAVAGEWTDVGNVDKYHQTLAKEAEFDFGKTEEFLYFASDRVIKFFVNPKVVEGRIGKATLKPHIFPAIEAQDVQFFAYRFAEGETMYQRCSPPLFSELLTWLEHDVWPVSSADTSRMPLLCELFYRKKTVERLAAFARKYPEHEFPVSLNGEPIAPLDALLERIRWDQLYEGVPAFIHGDLQFDNILHNKRTGSFTLLDWRQDFAGEIAYGDLYYDLAKLLGGLMVNYDLVKQGLFRVERSGSDLFIDFAVHSTCAIYARMLHDYIERRGLDFQRVRLLQALIYLNMSPLHHPPFDVALHALGARLLTSELGLVD